MKKTLRKLTALTMAAALVAVAALPVSAATKQFEFNGGSVSGYVEAYNAGATTTMGSSSLQGDLYVWGQAQYKDGHGNVMNTEGKSSEGYRSTVLVSFSWDSYCAGYKLDSTHRINTKSTSIALTR